MPATDWVNVNVGQLDKTKLANLVRETRCAVGRLDNVWPQGDSSRRAQVRVTRDQFGSYHIYLNQMALFCLLLYLKDVPHPFIKQDDSCPDDVPEFMRWGERALSDSEPAITA